MSRAFWVPVGIALLLELIIVNAAVGQLKKDDDGSEATPAVGRTAKLMAAGVAALFPVLWIVLARLLHLDGFSSGSIGIAAILEAALLVGWIDSPQEEGLKLFLGASGFMLVLILGTLAFHFMQKDR